MFYNMEDVDVSLQCDVCGKKLPNKNSWMRHRELSCPGVLLPLPLLICPSNLISHGTLCSFSYPSRQLLEIHMNEAQHPYICKHANCDSAGVNWRFNYDLLNKHEKSPHEKHCSDHLFQCPSNVCLTFSSTTHMSKRLTTILQSENNFTKLINPQYRQRRLWSQSENRLTHKLP